MVNPLPPAVSVLELPDGVRFRLPQRSLGPLRFVGIPLILIGLTIGGAQLWMVRAGIVFALFSIPSLLAGAGAVGFGLLFLAGHSEIEVRPGRLRAVERCGFIFWPRTRPTAGLRRFIIGSTNPDIHAGTSMDAPLADFCWIRPEWDAPKGWPVLLAPGYPRELLVRLAKELAHRCEVAVEPTAAPPAPVQVMDEAPIDLSPYPQEVVRPDGSKLQLTESVDGVTLLVPRLGMSQRGVLYGFAGGLVWFGLTVFTAYVGAQGNLKTGEGDDARPATVQEMLIVLPIFGAIGLGIMLGAVYAGRRQEMVSVAGDRLTYLRTSPLGSKRRQWRRSQIADVRLGYRVVGQSDDDGPPGQQARAWELQVFPHLGEGPSFLALGGHSLAELRWVIAVLRRALRLPHRPEGAPPPFVDRPKQPIESDIIVKRHADAVTLTLPPLGIRRAAPGFFLSCMFIFGFLILMDGLIIATGGLNDPGGIIVLGFTLIFWVAGIAGVIQGFQMGRRSTVLNVGKEELRVTMTGPLRPQEYRWRAETIADVRVDEGDLFVFGGRRRVELQVIPKEGKRLGFLVGRRDTELQWLATVLRQSLIGEKKNATPGERGL